MPSAVRRLGAVGMLVAMSLLTGACYWQRPTAVVRPEGRPGAPGGQAPSRARGPSAGAPGEVAVTVTDLRLRIRVLEGLDRLTVQAPAGLQMECTGGTQSLPAGAWTLATQHVRPAVQVFHVFVKGLRPEEMPQAEGLVGQWRASGYDARLVRLGLLMRSADGGARDGRMGYVSVGRYRSQAEAEGVVKRLQAQSVWGWVRPETVDAGEVTLTATGPGGVSMALRSPVRLRSSAPLELGGAGGAAWRGAGPYDLCATPAGRVDVIEDVGLEDYLEGVLPSEMPAGWPAEALKAQAVAARSETLMNLPTKHRLEGFDYCAAVHCRAYKGLSARHPASDAAVLATSGEVVTLGNRIVPAVFHADCGGWTEDNDAAWSSPPDPALRAVADLPPSAGVAKRPGDDIERWLRRPPPAYGGGPDFRWKRTLSAREASALVNRTYPVGDLLEIVPGERGPGGRLVSLTVRGRRGTQTIRKELPIRLAFGGLPSALFVVDSTRGKSGPEAFTCVGGGRGHGVGLCQYGARARAQEGADYRAILGHYYSGGVVERLR